MYKFLPILVFLFFRFAVSLLLESVPKESPKCFVTLPSFSSSWFSSTLPPLAPAEATALPTLAPRALAAALPAPRASLRLAVPSLPGLSLAVNVCFSSLLFSSLNHFSINHFFSGIASKESGGNANAANYNTNGSFDVGLYVQIIFFLYQNNNLFHIFSFFLIFSHFFSFSLFFFRWQINSSNWASCSGGSAPCSLSSNRACAQKVFGWGGNTWKYWSTCSQCRNSAGVSCC